MPSKYGNAWFYKSAEWRKVSTAYMESKHYICERCGRPATICHHKTWLNDVNVHDPAIALSFDNLECLCIDCHNAEHSSNHNKTLFATDGTVVGAKETAAAKQYRQERTAIDDVVAKAKALQAAKQGQTAAEASTLTSVPSALYRG